MTTWEAIKTFFMLSGIGMAGGAVGAWFIYRAFLKNAQLKMTVSPDWKEITQYIPFPEPVTIRTPKDDYIAGIRDLLTKYTNEQGFGHSLGILLLQANKLVEKYGEFSLIRGSTAQRDIIMFNEKKSGI